MMGLINRVRKATAALHEMAALTREMNATAIEMRKLADEMPEDTEGD